MRSIRAASAADRGRTPAVVRHQLWSDTSRVHADLAAAKALVYDPYGFTCSQPVPEAESADYAAHALTLDGLAVRFRVARTTPTEVGQFVTVWRRAPGGPIRPFDVTDAVDLFVIFVISSRDPHHFGQFVSPWTLPRGHAPPVRCGVNARFAPAGFGARPARGPPARGVPDGRRGRRSRRAAGWRRRR